MLHDRHGWRALALATALTGSGVGAIQLTEVQDAAGVDFEMVRDAFAPDGGGGCWIDHDVDGWPDLFLVQMVGPNQLYRNLGDGTFAAVPDAAGAADPEGFGRGAVAADYDNDGDPDLFVTNNGQNRLFRNQLSETGTASFVDVTDTAGLGGDGGFASSSASWADYDGDGFVDLYVASYIGDVRPTPMQELGCPNLLWHNQGDGTFRNVAPELGVDVGRPDVRTGYFTEPGPTFATTWSDYDSDGDPDVLVVHDFGYTVHPNQLFRNDGPDGEGGWIFTDASMETEFDVSVLGMGLGVGDYDNDGDLDYYATDGYENKLLTNRLDEGVDGFLENAAAAGVETYEPETYGPEVGPVSWGADFADLDNDGWLDLLVVNGFLDVALGATVPLQSSWLYRNLGDGTFVDVHASAGLGEQALAGRSSGFADYDRDGDVDLFIGSVFRWDADTESAGPARVRLYRNDTPVDASWLQVELVGTLGNRDSIGAHVRVTTADGTQLREVGTGRSFLASSELPVHFGLGGAVVVDELEVRWPSGVRYVARGLEVDQRRTLVEPRVTGGLELGATTVGVGEALPVELRLTNHGDLPQTGDWWLDLEAPDGTTRTLRTVVGLTLVPGGSRTARVPIVVPSGTAPGEQSLVLRYGNLPGGVRHQAYADFTVEP